MNRRVSRAARMEQRRVLAVHKHFVMCHHSGFHITLMPPDYGIEINVTLCTGIYIDV
jgi:hypothetical protein